MSVWPVGILRTSRALCGPAKLGVFFWSGYGAKFTQSWVCL